MRLWLAVSSALAILLTPGLSNRALAAGANIVWVSFHAADTTPSAAAATAGFTQAPDAEYTQLLRAAGHTVTRYITTATPDVNFLNTFDLVIVSRSVPSGNYQQPASTAAWHSITKPTILLGGYILRASRLGYTTGETIPDTGGPIRLTVNNPAHPIFSGVALDGANTMVNAFAGIASFNNIVQRGISVNSSTPADSATILATVGTDTDAAFGGMIIGEYAAGSVMANASGDVTAGKRLVLLTGSRENAGLTAEGSGIFDLEGDGVRLFLNSVSYMAGLTVNEPPPLVSRVRPSSGTTQYYAPLGFSFVATSSALGGIPANGISLELNGTDVTASLTVAGTAQERSVSFLNLVANTDYTAVIKVRDAGGRESSVTVNFDTRPAFALSPSFAFPVGAAVAGAPGMRARLAQGYDFPTLATSADRAEAQLASTLIDPTTGEPHPNFVPPSTDNPDGAYNQQVINWSVEALGFGVERGSFQAPAFPDAAFPGISHSFNIAAEVVTYLELSPGRYLMGVNSDDGFAVYTGVHHRDALAVSLGRFDGGRAASDTVFQFDVAEAGLYPFRLVYYQGASEGSVEWFSIDPATEEKILINDRNNPRAIRAWRQITAPERPYIVSLAPSPGQRNVAVNATLSIVLQDGGAQVQPGGVQLSLNGQPVSAQVNKAGARTTVAYTPSPNFQSDTAYSVSLTYTDSALNQRTAGYQFSTRFVPPVLPQGANIVWVSFHNADDEPSAAAAGAGFAEAPDVEYTRLLRAAGHTVTRYVTTASPDVGYLNTFDLVIISRSVPSGNYQQPDSTALWHSITKPTLLLGGYAIRGGTGGGARLGYTTGETIPDIAGTIRLRVNTPAHAIFSGIALDGANLMVRPYAGRVTFNGTLQRGISVNNNPVVSGATLLATVGTAGDPAAGGMIIAEYPAGTVMSNPSADTTAGKRLVLLTGSRENDGLTAEGSGIFDLESDGARLFLNAVRYMAGLPEPPSTEISLAAAASAQGLVISWPETGSQGFVLQATAALVPANWQAVSGDPVVAGGRRSVTVPTSESARFFRLFRP